MSIYISIRILNEYVSKHVHVFIIIYTHIYKYTYMKNVYDDKETKR